MLVFVIALVKPHLGLAMQEGCIGNTAYIIVSLPQKALWCAFNQPAKIMIMQPDV